MPKKNNKTYLGIKKTPIDDNTVFYASFDGSVVAEVGGATTLNKTFDTTATGLGISIKSNTCDVSITTSSMDVLTIDAIIKVKTKIGSWSRLFTLSKDSSNYIDLEHNTDNDSLYALIKINGTSYGTTVLNASTKLKYQGEHIHVRIIIRRNQMALYANGVSTNSVSYPDTDLSIYKNSVLKIGKSIADVAGVSDFILSDISISNIDRGDYFPTLPKDFIAGKANIAPAFNIQRKTYSDALTPQYALCIAKGNTPTANQDKCLTITQAVSGSWASGDTIKLKGMGGEIIGGVVDSDTAVCQVMETTTLTSAGSNATVLVNDTSKLAVNDTLKVLDNANLILTVNSITDATHFVITGTGDGNWSIGSGKALFETTTSTSSPVVKYSNAGVLTTVTGTWSNLGTNEATFTLGTNASLTNQDIQIEYSLNIVAGQGQVPVYSDILGGDVNGEKLTVGTVAIRDDFARKISGSNIECPHTVKSDAYTTLLTPSQGIELSVPSRISKLDGDIYSLPRSANGQISQMLISFNLIRLVEDKYGKIPAIDKVQWLKDNLSKITANVYVYGSCPSGNKAYLATWASLYTTWANWTPLSNTANVPSLLSSAQTAISTLIDSNGFIHYVAYTDASNGVTASTIYTDYCYIDVELKVPTGFTSLVPENPRRDEAWYITMADMKKTDDFSDKVSGSTIECAHISKTGSSTTLTVPSSFVSEYSTAGYIDFSKLDYILKPATISTNLNIPQQLFSFNLIEYVERKYGKIPAVDKVAWLKANLNKITCNWWGYGSCPAGNKAYLAVSNINNTYNGTVTNTSPNPTLLTTNVSALFNSYVYSDGFVHFLAYTDASNGTIASTIYTDYVNIEVELKESAISQLDYFKTRWVKNNVLLLRKETKEVQTFFPADGDNVSVVGQYVPYRGLGDIITKAKILAVGDPIITTLGTGGSDNLVNYSGIIGLSSRLPSIIEDYKLNVEKFKSDGINVDIDKLILKQYAVNGTNRKLYPVEGLYLQPYSTLTIVPFKGVNKNPALSSDSNSNGYYGSMLLQCSLPQTLPSEAIIAVPMLVTENNKIYMVVLSTKKSTSMNAGALTFYSNSITYDVFDIQGKPLIKG